MARWIKVPHAGRIDLDDLVSYYTYNHLKSMGYSKDSYVLVLNFRTATNGSITWTWSDNNEDLKSAKAERDEAYKALDTALFPVDGER